MPRDQIEMSPIPPWCEPINSYRYFKNPPGHVPGEPLAVDVGKNHVSLSWIKPETRDSAPVLAYKVESWLVGKEGGAIWKELGMTPITSYDVFNLKSGCEYHFRVTPRNRYGWGETTQTTTPILVGGAPLLPEFTKILPGQRKALLNHECVLECIVRGTPRPIVTWFKDGYPIDSTDRVSILSLGSTCRLRISQVFEIDSGRYTCEATNNQGKVSTFARLQVVSDPLIYETDTNLKKYISGELNLNEEMLPHFTMRLRDRRVQVTYPVRLTCQVIGLPDPTISWFKDGDEIETNERYLIFDDGQFSTLEIATTMLNDSGTYTAMAKNEHGSVSCHCILTVDKGIRAYIAPEFCVPLDPVYTFKECKEIRLSAQVEAYPAVGVSWLRNGIRIRPTRRIIANLDHDGFVELIIANANQRDAGIYSCIASNAVGRMESSCRVVVEPSADSQKHRLIPPTVKTSNMPYSKEPMFITKPRSSEAFEGDTVIIQCEVVGDPKPEVIWLRDFLNPDYYKDAPHFRRIGDGPEYRLIIPRAKLDFTGTYSVIAKNCHGEVKAIISLQIYAKDMSKIGIMDKGSVIHGNIETLPSVSRHLKDLRCCDGDSVTLECHVEGIPEPIIRWEKDGRTLHNQDDFLTAYNGSKATLTIHRIYPEDEGEYTCIASNNIGRAYSTACIIVDVPEEKENFLSRQLSRPPGFLSTCSTPRSTPRTTPIRSISPMTTLSYRNTSIDLTPKRRKFAAPKFLAIPHNKICEEGETVRFQCAIGGHPMPWSTWDKNGTIITPSTRVTIKERDDLRFLEIEEVTYDDAGLYRVTVENDYGRIEATARLDVIRGKRSTSRPIRTYSASPRRNLYFSRRIMGNSTAIGGRLSLMSTIRGSSVPARKFYHNGEEVVEDSRIVIRMTETEVSLTIDSVQEEDQGEYTCIAQDDFNIVTSSTYVTFYMSPDEIPEIPPEIIKPLEAISSFVEGDTKDLIFNVDSVESFSYRWFKDGEDIVPSEEFQYIEHGNGCIGLRIRDPFDMDTGKYKCVVTSVFGSCKTSTQLIMDESVDKLDREDLEILKDPLPSLAFFGDIVSFYAKTYPYDAETSWTVCGRRVDVDSREFSVEHQELGVHILHILGAEFKHSGEVQVTVHHPRNERCTIRSRTNLAVLPGVGKSLLAFDEKSNDENLVVPAHISLLPFDCTGLIGGTIVLKTAFIGQPSPTVKWLKAGRPVVESAQIQINTNANQSALILNSITGDDSGKYTVEVMNDYGSDQAAASVAVEGPPEPPSGKPSVSQGPDRVAVAWCGPPYDGGCMITGFILEMCENDAEWTEVATVIDSLAYTVKNLTPGSRYKFRVRAENIHGRSEASQFSDEVIIASNRPVENDNTTNGSIKFDTSENFKTRFEIVEELGRGRFGTVYKITEKESGEIWAAKMIKCIKSRDREKIHEEIEIMKSLSHPKLLHLAGVFDSPREIIMVMEYIAGGELFERVVADDFTLTERDCTLFLRQICEGVSYMHEKSIVHLDLKPENIMCRTHSCHEIKIIDFGLARKLTDNNSVRVLFGTPEFIAPEIINYEPIGFQTDMWSVGVLCYVLLSGLSPFMGDSDVETFANITRADYDFDDDAFDAVSEDAKDFISSLLINRKEDRLTAKECLETKWLLQYNEQHLSNVKICTDKLKKFIIRRKWQKTGNAIRALGRMATLSASRRNSSNSGSLPNSPRPSISTPSALFTPPFVVGHMTSLNEENDNIDEFIKFDNSLSPNYPAIRISSHEKILCSERSDSGFSECSSCSGGTGHVHLQTVDKVPVIHEELDSTSIIVPTLLVKKLEKIAQNQNEWHQEIDNAKPIDEISNNNENTSKSCPTKASSFEPIQKSATSGDIVAREPIMKSDFTNTIQMRKKSLENNAFKDKVVAKPIFESSGRVSKLKSRFTKPSDETVRQQVVSSKPRSKTNLDSTEWKMRNSKNVFERLTANNNNKSARTNQETTSSSVPSSPIPIRSTMRLTLKTGNGKSMTPATTINRRSPLPPLPLPPTTPSKMSADQTGGSTSNSNSSRIREKPTLSSPTRNRFSQQLAETRKKHAGPK